VGVSDDAQPLVSVIIPTYNRANLLPETLDSVLAQTWPRMELIVVDDGSTDSTPNALAPFLDRLRYVYQDNRGRSAARNAGVSLATGKFVVFLDSDDLLLPDGLRLQATYLERHPEVDVVYANGYTLADDGTLGPLEPFVVPTPSLDRLAIYRCLMRRNLFALHAGMVRRRALPNTKPFDESLHALEDRDLWTRMVIAGATIRYNDEKVIVYRRHAGNTRLDAASEIRSRIQIARNVIQGRLDSHLPVRLQQDFRLEFLYAVIASRSPSLIVETLQTILFPQARLSPYGLVALPVRFGTITCRALTIGANRAVPSLQTRLCTSLCVALASFAKRRRPRQ
jgi:glycosyltransferase involved in cell wall biosynthesis